MNNSERVVYTGITIEKYYDWGFPNPLNNPQLYKTEGGQTNNIALQSRDCFEYDFLGKHPTDKLLVFVIDEQVLQSTPWETIKAERLFLKEYKLTLEDLRESDWKISYTEE